MALVNQETGTNDFGAGSFTGLGGPTALILSPPQAPGPDLRNSGTSYPTVPFYTASGRESEALVINVAANAAFNLDYQFTTDGGAAGFTQSATLNIQVGYQYRVSIYNTTGGNLNGAYQWRLYSDNS